MEPRQSESRRGVQLTVALLLVALLLPAASFADDISLVKSNQWVNGTNTFVAENLGGYYWITGRVTAAFYSFTNLTELYIQDGTAGIRVLSKGSLFTLETNDTVFPPGVQVSVYGAIAQSNGLRMIRPERFNGSAYDTNEFSRTSSSPTTPRRPVRPRRVPSPRCWPTERATRASWSSSPTSTIPAPRHGSTTRTRSSPSPTLPGR